MQFKDILIEYGLADKESVVYLSLLQTGPQPVRVVARQTGINRGTAYDILKRLLDLGLVSFYRKGKQHFAAESPENLLDAMEDRRQKLQKLKLNLEDKLPELRTQFATVAGRPTIRVYEGAKGIRKILLDVINSLRQASKKEYYVYSSGTSKDRQLIYQEFPEFNSKRIEHGIKVLTIALGEGGETAGLDERKKVSVLQKDTKATHEIIYAGKIAHIGLDNSGNPVGVIIENTGIYETQKMIFENLWQKLK